MEQLEIITLAKVCDEDALMEFFSQQAQALTSLERATIYQFRLKTHFNKMAADLNKIIIPGMLVQCWNRSINYVKVDLCKRVFCNQ